MCITHNLSTPSYRLREFIPLSVEFCKLKFCIAIFYRPPSSDVNNFYTFCNIVENLNFHFGGRLQHWLFVCIHHRLKCLCELLSLHQVVTEPTHSSSSGNQTLIDQVLLSDMSYFVSCAVFPPLGNSNHNCVDVVLSPRKTNASKKLYKY